MHMYAVCMYVYMYVCVNIYIYIYIYIYIAIHHRLHMCILRCVTIENIYKHIQADRLRDLAGSVVVHVAGPRLPKCVGDQEA